ncbi:hypothetical protein HDU96_005935 [Phlyctochytrium bullatum]|nr:hypothetical protein HDU96_005935 [Phlyctochytrium bullatum]
MSRQNSAPSSPRASGSPTPLIGRDRPPRPASPNAGNSGMHLAGEYLPLVDYAEQPLQHQQLQLRETESLAAAVAAAASAATGPLNPLAPTFAPAANSSTALPPRSAPPAVNPATGLPVMMHPFIVPWEHSTANPNRVQIPVTATAPVTAASHPAIPAGQAPSSQAPPGVQAPPGTAPAPQPVTYLPQPVTQLPQQPPAPPQQPPPVASAPAVLGQRSTGPAATTTTAAQPITALTNPALSSGLNPVAHTTMSPSAPLPSAAASGAVSSALASIVQQQAALAQQFAQQQQMFAQQQAAMQHTLQALLQGQAPPAAGPQAASPSAVPVAPPPGPQGAPSWTPHPGGLPWPSYPPMVLPFFPFPITPEGKDEQVDHFAEVAKRMSEKGAIPQKVYRRCGRMVDGSRPVLLGIWKREFVPDEILYLRNKTPEEANSELISATPSHWKGKKPTPRKFSSVAEVAGSLLNYSDAALVMLADPRTEITGDRSRADLLTTIGANVQKAAVELTDIASEPGTQESATTIAALALGRLLHEAWVEPQYALQYDFAEDKVKDCINRAASMAIHATRSSTVGTKRKSTTHQPFRANPDTREPPENQYCNNWNYRTCSNPNCVRKHMCPLCDGPHKKGQHRDADNANKGGGKPV